MLLRSFKVKQSIRLRFRSLAYRYSTFHSTRVGSLRQRWLTTPPKPVLLLSITGLSSLAIYLSYPYIGNGFYDQQLQTYSETSGDTLVPDPNGDTYEMGIFLSSQRQQQQQRQQQRDERIAATESSIKRALIRLMYKFTDNVLDPMFTVLRFVEISSLLLPILISYPFTLLLGDERSKWWYKLIRVTMEFMGPSFIKLGQWAASRTDIFSDELCEELGKLHSNVRPHSLDYTEKKLCELFNVDEIDDVFDSFTMEPVGVGAIAQVHIGKFRENVESLPGGTYAIKILHPTVREKIHRDLSIMHFWANLINRIPTMEWLSLPVEVEQFAILMNLQLDLRIEALNLQKFRDNFRYIDQVKFPKPLIEFSNKDILFEEYIDALPMQSFLRVKSEINNIPLCQKVSNTFVNAFLKMLILDDFIHADLHPGNVMLRFLKTGRRHGGKTMSTEEESDRVMAELRKSETDPERFVTLLRDTLRDYTPQVCFLDVGLVTELNEVNSVNFIDLFNALAVFDGYRAGELMVERSRTPETAIDKEGFAKKVDALVSEVKRQTFTLGSISIGNLLDQMLSMVRTHHVRMEGDFVSVVVAILLLEGIGRQLDPELDLFDRSVPILGEYALRRENRKMLNATSTLNMVKILFGLEVRQLLNLSVKHMYDLLESDQLCPNY